MANDERDTFFTKKKKNKISMFYAFKNGKEKESP